MSSVRVPVVDDKLLEGENETFELMLTVPSSLEPAIRGGSRNKSIGIINDTTSKHVVSCTGIISYIRIYIMLECCISMCIENIV